MNLVRRAATEREAAPTLLIVDDAQFMRRYIGLCLARIGLRVVGEAMDGDTAVDLHRRLRPDVTTLDLVMPKCGGLAALARIRAEDPQALVVVVSAVDQDEVRRHAVGLGAAAFQVKPFTPDVLAETVQRLLAADPLRSSSR